MKVNAVNVPVPAADPGAVTFTAADPGKVNKAAHGLVAGTPICFNVSGGSLPAELHEGVEYYVTNPGVNDFEVAQFPGGPSLKFSGAGSGAMTCHAEVLRINVSDYSRVGVVVKNTGANALTLFDTYVAMKAEHTYESHDQTTQEGTITDVKTNSAAVDYTTPVYPAIRASASPVTLAAGASVVLFFDTSAVAVLSFRATAAGGTTISVEGAVEVI